MSGKQHKKFRKEARKQLVGLEKLFAELVNKKKFGERLKICFLILIKKL